ncbi:uncharacterized protein TNCV_1612271 [Trichonephila clavipes]|nr:uncharacterized protein TNCV_1612271 [Trichonephila clavipes]
MTCPRYARENERSGSRQRSAPINFKKNHEDGSLSNEDKFQYLSHAVVSSSKAVRVVESFPGTADNCPKAVAQLQERFGRENLLVQIYVRDLLSMVMKNAATGRSKTDLPTLYDKLEAKIQALESLGRTQDKYGEFLSPLVETCLPEDILLAFERSKNFKEDTPGEGRTSKLIMNFLKQEVKNDEMVNLLGIIFQLLSIKRKRDVNRPYKFPSAATLVSTHDKSGTAAWWGGFWERLVRTVKELLRRTLGKAIFTYEELLAISCECEKVVNSRPLTYLSEDMQDLTPITPARFLFEIATADTKDLDARDANHFRKRLRFRAKLIDELKRRFKNKYFARVIKLIPGKDGLVRTVKLKTQSCTLIRPIQRVFPLEMSGNDATSVPLQKVQHTDSSVNCPNPDTLKATEKTRCGRPVKKPIKLNLLTLADVFD